MSLVSPPIETFADVLARLGGVPLDRILVPPAPGTATERDVLQMEQQQNRLCELVDGVLVEKPMGYRESLLAGLLVTFLNQFVLPRRLGLVTGADGMIRLYPGLVRIPDVAFVRWEHLPGGRVPDDPIPDLVPDLAVEVLSRTNTSAEMRRKREEYFDAGVTMVWTIDPEERTATVFDGLTRARQLSSADTLDGDPVLPGFSLRLSEFFGYLDQPVQEG